MKLRKPQKAEFVELIQDHAYRLRDQFVFKDSPDNVQPTEIALPEHGFYFILGGSIKGIEITTCPGDSTWTESFEYPAWGKVSAAFSDWLFRIEEELHEADPWKDFPKSNMRFSSEAENDPLSKSEIEAIKAGIERAKSILTCESENRDEIIARFDSIERNLDRIGRKDLYLLAFGIMCDIAINRLASTDSLLRAWNTLKAAFGTILECALTISLPGT